MSVEVLAAVVGVVAVVLFLRRRRDETVVMPGAGSQASSSTDAAAGGDPIERAILRGRKIEAIKHYREQHAVGLREAKETVEEIERRLRQR
jgi:ribosomal protein L7/L12